MHCPVDYEDESTGEHVGNPTGVSEINYLQTVNTNARYRSYYEVTTETIKYHMD